MAKNDIRQKLAEFKINGYVIFEDLLPAEKVDKLQAAFLPLLENVRAMTLGHPTPGPQFEPRVVGDRPTGQGRLLNVNRYNVEVPWQSPFSDPEVYQNPVLLEFLDCYWGTDDYLITLYSSNTPYPGSEYQPVAPRHTVGVPPCWSGSLPALWHKDPPRRHCRRQRQLRNYPRNPVPCPIRQWRTTITRSSKTATFLRVD